MLLSTAFIREIVNAVNLPACLIDADGELISTNVLFEAFAGTGMTLRPLRNIREGFTFRNGALDEFLTSVIAEGIARDRFCSLINLSTGQMVDTMMRGIPFRDEHADATPVLLVFNAADSYDFGAEEYHGDGRVRNFSAPQLRNLVRNQSRELDTLRSAFDQVRGELGEEMDMARAIQNSMMPSSLPDFVNVRTACTYIPAGAVGGDFYDIITTPDSRLAVLIFDVSGHGVPAALIGAMARMLFIQGIERYNSPARIFDEVNRQLCRFIKTDHYLTALLGIIDPSTNVMTYSRAGHVRPIHWRAADGGVSALSGKGFFIGHQAIADMAVYEDCTVSLAPGDKLLLYTDGLVECNDRAMTYYGSERLAQTVGRFGRLPLETFLRSINDDVKTFRSGTGLKDDITVLCLEIGDPAEVLRDSGFPHGAQPESYLVRRMEDIPGACGIILRRMDQNGFPDLEIKRMRVCIFEMLVNAVVHGNKRNNDKRVVVLYIVSSDSISVSIADEGEGFDYRHLPDPLAEENLLNEHGRGIFIVRSYMDEISFNEAGNRIFVSYRLPGAGAKTAD